MKMHLHQRRHLEIGQDRKLCTDYAVKCRSPLYKGEMRCPAEHLALLSLGGPLDYHELYVRVSGRFLDSSIIHQSSSSHFTS
jgi:hypothetical protein